MTKKQEVKFVVKTNKELNFYNLVKTTISTLYVKKTDIIVYIVYSVDSFWVIIKPKT